MVVSPEFMLRPSLSASACDTSFPCVQCGTDLVSPEFMLRPSLSAHRAYAWYIVPYGAAGACRRSLCSGLR